MKMKTKILELLNNINRPGVQELIKFLEESDFFVAPASTKYHGNFEGGLAEHSINVYEVMSRKNRGYAAQGSIKKLPEETVIITGLLHDLCKVNFYTKDFKNVCVGTKLNDWGKEVKDWQQQEVIVIDDKFPYGHGEKSVSIIQDFIKLTDQEKMLIRWHMGLYDQNVNMYAFNAAMDMYPEIVLIQTADMEASRLYEKTADQIKGENSNG